MTARVARAPEDSLAEDAVDRQGEGDLDGKHTKNMIVDVETHLWCVSLVGGDVPKVRLYAATFTIL